MINPPDGNAAPRHPVADEQLDTISRRVIWVLRCGFYIASGLMIAGIAIILLTDERVSSQVDPVEKIPGKLASFDGGGFIDLAILALLLTPVCAIAAVARGFHQIGDRRYTTYSLLVLAILGLSITVSLVR